MEVRWDAALAQTTTESFTTQATAAIHEDSVTGPGVGPFGNPVVATYGGDGKDKSFDFSNNIDMSSARLSLVFNVNLTITNGNLTNISASISQGLSGASPSHELTPADRSGPNTLTAYVAASLNGKGGTVSFFGMAHNSLAPGSALAPILVSGELHFSSTGAYQGMKGVTSGYPWIQIREFQGGRAIDNVMVSPAMRAPVIELWKTVPFQSGYWR